VLLAKTAIQFAWRPEGWIHSVQGGFDVPRGPVGVLFFLAFVPPFWAIPRHWRAAYLSATSLLLALGTVGPAYTAMLLALALLGFAVVRLLAFGTAYWAGAGLLVAGYAALLWRPQPPWLPPVREPLYFYVHWAGIGYLFLKTLHVLTEFSRGSLPAPRLGDWLAYLLFAPSLRMGPIYRYPQFLEQMHGDPAADRQLGRAAVRIISGLVRLGILGILVDQFPLRVLFDDPGQLSAGQFVLRVYLAPLTFFLWISGYVELSVGVGRAMGFVVPENFNYPWTSANIAEFWQRWHITLGAWLRDYIFTPMVRRRWHFAWAFTITFLMCGLWHGPNACYVIWGTAQGVGLAVLRVWTQYWKRQQSRATPLYRRLARLGLVHSPLATALAWLLTFHYEVVTILIGMDLDHAGFRVGLRALSILWPAAR
jgi:D-alanyl-lipoteichoic acid acyltransferase DltB (MBOAT superfamily)